MIAEKIVNDYKQALKDKNALVVESLRNLKAEIKNVEIAKQKTLDDEQVMQVISKKVKQHKDSIESFKAGNRMDLVEHEMSQMKILADYMPEQLTDQEIEALVVGAVKSLDAKPGDFGKVMKEVVQEAKGRADGSRISPIVKKVLSQ
jgi:uncharacterized protein YqeY